MRFQVPQFIEKENKLIGPLTLRQFLWSAGGVGIIVILQFFLEGKPLYIGIVVVAILTTSMVYMKIDEVPLPKYIARAFMFMLMNKYYTYQKENGEDTKEQ